MSDLSLTSLDQRLRAVETKVGITAPTTTTTTIDPWRKPFAATSPWNQKVTGTGAKTSDYWGSTHWPSRDAVPVYVQPASGGTTWTVVCPQGTITGRFNSTLNPGSDSDQALCLVIGNDVWSFWVCTIDGTNHVSSKLGIKCPLNGTGFGTAPGVKAGTRAPGFPLLGGLITAQNMADKVIPHALVGAIPRSCLNGTSPGYVWPAVTADSGWQTSYTGSIRMGSRWAIPKGTPCPSSDADLVTIWTCLQTYGMFVGDADATGLALYLERTGTTDTLNDKLGGIMKAIVAAFVPVTSAA